MRYSSFKHPCQWHLHVHSLLLIGVSPIRFVLSSPASCNSFWCIFLVFCCCFENIEAAKSTAAYWKVLSEATNPKRRPRIGPFKRDDNTLAVRDEEKANLMNAFFANIGASLWRNSTRAPVVAEIDIAPIQSVSDVSICENSISRKIKALKVNKAEGPDGITPEAVTVSWTCSGSGAHQTYSLSAKAGEVFSLWKKAHLCPVFKKDDPTDRSNYRPISLLSVPSKILESCVSDTILQHVVDNGMLTERQWAYRKVYSTQLSLTHLTECWGNLLMLI